MVSGTIVIIFNVVRLITVVPTKATSYNWKKNVTATTITITITEITITQPTDFRDPVFLLTRPPLLPSSPPSRFIIHVYVSHNISLSLSLSLSLSFS
mmetsp:Transcript_26952/g.29031  ORF Transcript_26952/g.29031 Transcript_26952/m.29031 type:complete len:97 (-) Transcript_26952:22-312(-)